MFGTAIKFLDNYRKRREQALTNNERQRWFTTELSDVSTLFSDTFNSDKENDDWQQLVSNPEKPADKSKLQAIRTKIALLTSYRHDLRVQFAVGADHHIKTEADFDRHAVNENRMAAFRLAVLDGDLTVREKGVEVV
jgi:hypothetical protein